MIFYSPELDEIALVLGIYFAEHSDRLTFRIRTDVPCFSADVDWVFVGEL